MEEQTLTLEDCSVVAAVVVAYLARRRQADGEVAGARAIATVDPARRCRPAAPRAAVACGPLLRAAPSPGTAAPRDR
jgi:hypothetical protein